MGSMIRRCRWLVSIEKAAPGRSSRPTTSDDGTPRPDAPAIVPKLRAAAAYRNTAEPRPDVSSSRSMRPLLVAAFLVAGCASTNGPTFKEDREAAYFERRNQQINASETQCVNEAKASSDHETANISAGPGASTDLQAQQLANERVQRLNECRSKADREREELSARERSHYQTAAQEERDRNSLIMILTTTSRPH